jgi:hypothetical protein
MNNSLKIIWGAANIGRFVGEDDEQSAFRLCAILEAEGTITKVGRRYAGLEERLRERFAGKQQVEA